VTVRTFGEKDLAEFRARMDELRTELPPPPSRGEFVAHTDGACLGNPDGPGGWAAIVDPPAHELWGPLSSTSNNRAEALGFLAALEWVPAGSSLTIRSDSELSVRIFQGVYKAKKNTDIWQLILHTRSGKELIVHAEWLRGHAGDPRNELADRLSKRGAIRGIEPRSDWERGFLGSVLNQLRGGRALSAKQEAVLERMRQQRR
jgi:ribonuclease HI